MLPPVVCKFPTNRKISVILIAGLKLIHISCSSRTTKTIRFWEEKSVQSDHIQSCPILKNVFVLYWSNQVNTEHRKKQWCGEDVKWILAFAKVSEYFPQILKKFSFHKVLTHFEMFLQINFGSWVSNFSTVFLLLLDNLTDLHAVSYKEGYVLSFILLLS